MLQLINHIVRTSARRNRTEINAALVEAMADLFQPAALAIYRCFSSDRRTVVFPCAGIGPDGPYARNAYLPDRQSCRAIDDDPLLKRCKQERSVAFDVLPDGANRLVFPVIHLDRLAYLLDVTVPADMNADQRVLLMGMAEYFSNQIGLLDYGETDTLTGLANRKTFDKHLFVLLGRACADAEGAGLQRRRGAEGDASHWLAVCDIDHFKAINDSHGHLLGDEVLVAVSQVMRHSFRFDDQPFRFGGEEFVVVLQPASREDAFRTLDRFRANIETQVGSRIERVGKVSVSVGCSRLRPNDTPADVIDRADEALYFAKGHGRNQVAMYEELVETGRLAARDAPRGEMVLF